MAAEIAAGHDGEADLVLTVCYENGVAGSIILDASSAFEVMESCGALSAADLVGRTWRDLLKGI